MAEKCRISISLNRPVNKSGCHPFSHKESGVKYGDWVSTESLGVGGVVEHQSSGVLISYILSIIRGISYGLRH